MEVIVSLTDRVIVFNQGHVIAEGAPREVMTHPEVIEAYLGRSMTRERRGRRST
jgi:ABC-type branched-subunit amino acid transport system ATPase component